MLNTAKKYIRHIVRGLARRTLRYPSLSDVVIEQLAARRHTADQLVDRLLSDESQWNHVLASLSSSPRLLGRLAKSKSSIDNVLVFRYKEVLDKPHMLGMSNAARQLAGVVNPGVDSECLERTAEFASMASYRLPTYLVSFPRSGSNFVQSVLRASSSMFCRSMYGRLILESEPVLSLKSHAISPGILREEIELHRPLEPVWPEKIIVITRDPRDVMISFYEMVQSSREVIIPQGEFLHNVDYMWAAYGNLTNPLCHLLTFPRKDVIEPLSVCEAFRHFTGHWHGDVDFGCDTLKLRFEDLTLQPHSTFGRIFDFLDLDCELAEESLGRKVAQYSVEKRQRGKAGGWKDNVSKYSILLEQVHEALADEIETLGYDPSFSVPRHRKSA